MDFSLSELLVLAVVAVLLVRPADWPELMRGLGRAVGWVRRESSQWMQWLENWDKPVKEKILGQDGKYYETFDLDMDVYKIDSDAAPAEADKDNEK